MSHTNGWSPKICSGVCATLLAMLLCLIPAVVRAQTDDEPNVPVAPAAVESPDVIGGREAEPGSWPWQAALVNHFAGDAYLGQFCGGTVISPEWVLTAAHCVDGAEASRVDVLLGAHRLSDGGLTVRAEDILIHPDYDPFLSDSDLALIHLSEPVTYTPISLYRTIPDETEQSHVRATTIGWGASDIGDFFSITYPDALREVSIPLVDFDTCYSAYGGGITENMLCAGYEKLLKGSCYGDSGGPLMVQDTAGAWLQVGIVSFGPYGCISFGLYDVFTRVGAFTDWIDACVANMDTAACNGADLYEPDNSMAAARVYADFGTSEMHTFHVAGDQDWLRFDVKKDHLYVVSTASVNDFTTLVDTVIWLFEEDGFTPITYNDEGPSIPFISQVASWAVRNRLGAELDPPDFYDDSLIIWQADATGSVYLSVENLALDSYYSSTTGANARYRVQISEYAGTAYMPLITTGSPITAQIPTVGAIEDPIIVEGPITAQSIGR